MAASPRHVVRKLRLGLLLGLRRRPQRLIEFGGSGRRHVSLLIAIIFLLLIFYFFIYIVQKTYSKTTPEAKKHDVFQPIR
jgi:hypothetical protein